MILTAITTSGASVGESSLSGHVLTMNQDVDFKVEYFRGQFYVINFYTLTAPSSIK